MSDSSFGARVLAGMRAKDLDYRALAAIVGVSHGYLWQLVNAEKRAVGSPAAKRKLPSPGLVRQLADALDLDAATLAESAGLGAGPDVRALGPTRYAVVDSELARRFGEAIEQAKRPKPDRAIALFEGVLHDVRVAGGAGGVSAADVLAGLGMSYVAAGRFRDAAEAYTRALAEPEPGRLSPAELHYNRGLAAQKLARTLSGQEAARARRASLGDFRRAIALAPEGPALDLAASALCYGLLEGGRPGRVLPFARAFWARMSVSPTPTTAALDVGAFLAMAHALAGAPRAGLDVLLPILALQPAYWFTQYVAAALHARLPGLPALRRGLLHAKEAVRLNPEARAHLRAEAAGDFAAWAEAPDFRALLAGKDS